MSRCPVRVGLGVYVLYGVCVGILWVCVHVCNKATQGQGRKIKKNWPVYLEINRYNRWFSLFALFPVSFVAPWCSGLNKGTQVVGQLKCRNRNDGKNRKERSKNPKENMHHAIQYE